MLELGMDVKDVVDSLAHHGPKNVDRASRSALGSLGYKLRAEVQKQIRGGYGWPRKVSRFPAKKGMRWWARFIRYRVFDEQAMNVASGMGVQAGARGQTLQILPAKDQKGETDDKFLSALFYRFEHGRRIKVTPSMRRKLAGRTDGKLGIKKETSEINFQARPIFGPAWGRQKTWAPAFFTNKFLDNLARYQSGMSVYDWKNINT